MIMLISRLGFIVNPSHSHLGASPDGLLASPDRLLASCDGLLMCDCCGLGVLEIKCPYILSGYMPSLYASNDNDTPSCKTHQPY